MSALAIIAIVIGLPLITALAVVAILSHFDAEYFNGDDDFEIHP